MKCLGGLGLGNVRFGTLRYEACQFCIARLGYCIVCMYPSHSWLSFPYRDTDTSLSHQADPNEATTETANAHAGFVTILGWWGVIYILSGRRFQSFQNHTRCLHNSSVAFHLSLPWTTCRLSFINLRSYNSFLLSDSRHSNSWIEVFPFFSSFFFLLRVGWVGEG